MTLPGLRLLAFAALAVLEIIPAAAGGHSAAAPSHAAPADGAGKFGDWGVRCFPAPSPAPCDMSELLTQKNTGKRIMSLSIAYAPSTNRQIIQFVLPLGVSIPKGATLIAGAYASPRLFYRHCNKIGCFIEGYVEDSLITALARPNIQAKMMVTSDHGRPLTIPFSLRGFSQAYGAMVALDRQKAAVPAASTGK